MATRPTDMVNTMQDAAVTCGPIPGSHKRYLGGVRL